MKTDWVGLKFLAGLVVMGVLTGCSLIGSTQETPVVQMEMTAIAESVESMRREITSLAPTITALAAMMQAMDTVQALPTETAALPPTLTPILQTQLTPSLPTAPPLLSATPSTPAAAPTTLVLPTLTAMPEQDRLGPQPTPFDHGAVILQDDFASPFGWYEDETPRFTLDYSNGGYRMFIMTKNNPIWSIREKGIGDVVLEADAQQTGGPIDSYYGLVCRFVNGKNYYMLVVSEDGNLRIIKVKDGKLTTLAQSLVQAGAIRAGQVNRLRADCISQNGVTALTLYINDQYMLAAQDGEYQSGGLGFVAGNTTTSGVEVLFDNLLAKAPAP